MTEPKARKTSWMPSNKWISATVLGAATIGTGWATAGHWSSALTISAIGIASQRLVAYFTPNSTG
jgi:hypothetical protein